jgi:hypothetical protein
MPFHGQHEKGIELIKGVEDAEKVAGMALCREDEKVAERRGEQSGKLLLREKLCDGSANWREKKSSRGKG